MFDVLGKPFMGVVKPHCIVCPCCSMNSAGCVDKDGLELEMS